VILTIIVPTFNAAEDLPRLLNSLSIDSSVEVIFADDGSTDRTQQILKDWCDEHPSARLLVLRHSGPGKARSAGLAAATGRYVTFADADDELSIDLLRRGSREADVTGAEVVIFSYEEVKAPQSEWVRGEVDVYFAPCGSAQVLLDRAAIWGKVFRRDFLRLRRIDFEPLRSADDVIFSWEVAASRPKTLHSKAVAYRYFTHEHAQLTRDPLYFVDGVESLAILLRQRRGRDLYSQVLAGYAWASGTVHILRKTRADARLQIVRGSVASLVRIVRDRRSKPLSAKSSSGNSA
jgi:glycosyltransferase involved in cell wall biosynthesis